MDKARAVKLLDDTFKKNFDIDQFSKFIKELFNNIQINIQDKTQYIANQFKEYIAECKKIADYKDASKKSMEILAVKLKKASSRDRARTMQRNFISSWLSKQEIDAALVAFYGDDNEDWRFSYIKMEYNLIKNEDEKVIIAKELTPAKRYSFLVGTNEPNHTCQRQFLDLVIEESTNPSISQIEQAFSVEKVTKEFFEKYKELTINLKDALDEILPKNQRIITEFDRKGISAIDFSKKLMGQVVFIYFLQKKGWLGVQKRSDGTFDEWGTGPRNFLRKLFYKKIVPYDNFFNDILEPLFYEALATDRSADNDYYSRFKCKIPFLNGGLFEPLNDYDWTGTDISIPNELFSNSIKTQTGDVGTGILDVFDRYNFTVKEDDPIDKEVAVDPEMLGKVFENLLDVKERKDKGAFYTPREIVHYMCQQSLINYLETNTQDIPRDDIERFVQYGDIALDQTIKSLAQKERYNGKSYVDEKLLVPKSIADNYQKIDKLLQDIKIVDPAVGSGAFPVGMMNEIVKARSILTIFFSPDEQESRTEYNLKRQCIENCLYGVDIDPSAVEIAKLRFWLSLIVGEEKRENIQPLPNLDHKIMCGNSLLEEFEGIKLFDERLLGEVTVKTPTEVEIDGINEQILMLNDELKDIGIGNQRPEIKQKIEQRETLKKRKETLEKRLEKEKRQKDKDTQITIDHALERRIKESQIKLSKLKKLQKEFFNEQNRNKKKNLREEIDKIEWELIETTLEEQGHEEAMAKLEQYRKTNVKPFFLWKLYFAEVFQRENPGFDVVIANPPYIRIHKQDKEYKEQIKSSYYSAFKDYDIYILFFEKSLNILRNEGVMTYITPDKYLIREYGTKIRELLLRNTIVELFDVSRANDIFNAATYPLISIIMKSSKSGLITVKFARTIKNIYHDFDEIKIDQQLCRKTNLIELIHPDDKKVIDKIYNGSKSLSEIISKNQIFCGTPRAKDYHSWQKYITSERYLKKSLRLLVCSHLSPYFIDKKKKVRTLGLSVEEPYFINENAMGDSMWENFKYIPKIIIRGNDTRITAALDDKGSVFIGMYGIKAEERIKENYKFLLALLNCKLYQWIFAIQNPSVKIAGDFFSINSPQLLRLPFREDKCIEKSIILLVDQILSITKDDDYMGNPDKQVKVNRLEKEIDQLVYELYDLTPEEIKIVEEFNEKSRDTPKKKDNVNDE